MKIGSNLSGVYRFRMPQGHYAFVQTKSKLHRNESSSAAEFVISTHSIVRCAEELSVLSLLSLLLLPAGCRKAANCRYCFYSQAKNQVFRPAGATRCTDSGQTLQYWRAPGSAWLGKISRQSVQAGGNAAPKISKISTFLVKSRPAGATPLTDFQNF